MSFATNAGVSDAFIVKIGGLEVDSISGKITSSASGDPIPIPNVEVWAYNDEYEPPIEEWGFTDGTGFYQMLFLSPGCYEVQAFPEDFYINYHLYRNYWPLMALGRYRAALESTGGLSA